VAETAYFKASLALFKEYVGEGAQFLFLYLRYMWGRRLVENVIWREGPKIA